MNEKIKNFIKRLEANGFVYSSGKFHGFQTINKDYTKKIGNRWYIYTFNYGKGDIIETINYRENNGDESVDVEEIYSMKYDIDLLQHYETIMSKKSPEQLTAIAYSIVASAFVEVLDKGGRPYFEHCLAVCRKLGPYCSEERKQIAILHDYLEDIKGASSEELLSLGFKQETVHSIFLLSKLSSRREIYSNGNLDLNKYYSLIKTDKDATLVKMSDLRHNSDLRRLKGNSDSDLARSNKYQSAYYDLEKHARKQGWI